MRHARYYEQSTGNRSGHCRNDVLIISGFQVRCDTGTGPIVIGDHQATGASCSRYELAASSILRMVVFAAGRLSKWKLRLLLLGSFLYKGQIVHERFDRDFRNGVPTAFGLENPVAPRLTAFHRRILPHHRFFLRRDDSGPEKYFARISFFPSLLTSKSLIALQCS